MTTLPKNDPVKKIQSQAWYELVWHMKLSYEKVMNFISMSFDFIFERNRRSQIATSNTFYNSMQVEL